MSKIRRYYNNFIDFDWYKDSMEKNSSPVLTEQDLEEYRQGRVSERISEIWGLTFEELRAIIESHEAKSKD